MSPGGLLGLQIRWEVFLNTFGGFDSHTLPPTLFPQESNITGPSSQNTTLTP